ncbi:PD-(D/E)XK nuclease family protein [Janibacter limosus]|uniref:PD-(D/E)XK nuclease family protein n=2 Tax=Janibacter limosus TaxID=53458 RepID=A0AC61U932_9MICO|nr:UrvD/REP family ATP-dependent DNA helicase [Janibacter limosus]UUZ46266.1 PD-(D/E)XK nuclease family protein [Janibacter limosus]
MRLVVVDDAQELTAPAAGLLRALTGEGVDLVLVGDPDVAVRGFRGADPHHLVDEWPGRRVTTHLPGHGHRLPEQVHAAAARVVPKIAALGGGAQRSGSPAAPGGVLEAHVLHSSAREAAFIAHELRAAHLLDGVPWQQMAVVVRGAARQATLRRVPAARGVPVLGDAHRVAVRDEPAARPLLHLLSLVVDPARDRIDTVPAADVVDLLASPLVAADTVAIRRLRRALRRDELAAGGIRTSDELLGELVLDPEHLIHLGHDAAPLHRLALVVAAGRAAARAGDDGAGWAPGVSAESVLWQMWQAADVADTGALRRSPVAAAGPEPTARSTPWWRSSTQRPPTGTHCPPPGPTPSSTRSPGRPSQPTPSLRAAPTQTPSPSSRRRRPPATSGTRSSSPVCRRGVWPDLRLRGSLLGSERLVDIVTGRDHTGAGAAAAVRHDETRLFHVALTRATDRVLVTAVAAEDEQPSVYLDIVDPLPQDVLRREPTDAPAPLDLTGLVARLRQQLASTDPAAVARAVARLALLAAAGVAGASPSSWWALRDLSDTRPVRQEGIPVTVSPSKVQLFTDCGLRWLLQSAGGDGPSQTSAEVGTLIHALAHDLGDAGEEAFRAELERRWPSLGMAPGWVTDQKLERARAMAHWLAEYHQRAAHEGWRPVATEERFRVELGRAVLQGSVDRLEVDAHGRVRVIDYKTGSSAPTAKDLSEHPQLGSYRVAIAEGGFGEHGTEGAGRGPGAPGQGAHLQERRARTRADRCRGRPATLPRPDHRRGRRDGCGHLRRPAGGGTLPHLPGPLLLPGP